MEKEGKITTGQELLVLVYKFIDAYARGIGFVPTGIFREPHLERVAAQMFEAYPNWFKELREARLQEARQCFEALLPLCMHSEVLRKGKNGLEVNEQAVLGKEEFSLAGQLRTALDAVQWQVTQAELGEYK